MTKRPEMKEMIFFIPMPLYVPGVLTRAAVGAVALSSPHFLLAVPFVWLGAVCSATDHNLANGCFAGVAMIIGFVFAPFTWWGAIVFGSTLVSWFLSGFERIKRARPVEKPDN